MDILALKRPKQGSIVDFERDPSIFGGEPDPASPVAGQSGIPRGVNTRKEQGR